MAPGSGCSDVAVSAVGAALHGVTRRSGLLPAPGPATAEGDLLFDVPAYSQTCKLLRKDLKKAGIPYQDANGRYCDFHAFRKCTASFLRQAGVDPSVSMRYLDHSDIRMTMQVYNDEDLLDARSALDAMPRLVVR